MTPHVCTPPLISALTMPMQPDWTCGVCGRLWRDWVVGSWRQWAEVKGPWA